MSKYYVAVSGANGFTGRHVCRELKSRNIKFVAIIRPGTDPKWMIENSFSYIFADLNNIEELIKVLNSSDALINTASIGFISVPALIKACNYSKIKRVVFFSTTAIFTKLNAKSKAIRKEAENLITSSELQWTILRPTMIYGTPEDRNMIRLVKWIDKWPFIPIFGDGKSLQQPVNVVDVAWSAVEVLNNNDTLKKAFTLSGKSALTYNQVIDITSKIMSISR